MHIDFFNAHSDDIISELPISRFFVQYSEKEANQVPNQFSGDTKPIFCIM
jgi:hypothetical protein